MSKQPFGLAENPFASGHDPRLVYSNRERKDLLVLVRQAIADGEPFVLVTGDGGIGKTLAVSDALADEDLQVCAVFLAHPTLRRDELLEAICIAFGVEADFESKPQTLASLGQHFAGLRGEGRRPVLVMDEAHALGEELLEELRLLSNLESEGQPLLQIVLVGLPELERRLARPELAPLRQRIAVQGQVRPLSAQDTERYIHQRVAAAGGEGPKLFSSDTCFEIHRFTYGFPRDINRIASRAMARAQRAAAGTVLADHVRAAMADSRLRSEEPGTAATGATGSAAPRSRTNPQTAAAAWSASVSDLAGSAAPSGSEGSPERAEDPGPVEPAAAEPVPPPAPREAEPVPEHAPPMPGEASQDIDAWVSRFIGDGPPKIGSRAGATGAFAEADAPGAPGGEASAGEAPRSRRRRSGTVPGAEAATGDARPAPGQWDVRRLTLAAVAVVAVALAGVLIPRALRLGGGARSAPTATAPTDTTEGSTSVAAPDSVKAKPEPAARAETKSTRRYAIRVATYLNRERAEDERDRIARTTGLYTRIWDAREDGAAVHHIVVGSYDDAREAERSADDLLQRGLVQEGRVLRYRSRERGGDR